MRHLLALIALLCTPALAQDYSGEPAAIADNFTTSEDTVGSIGQYPPDAVVDEAKARFSCEYSHANYDDSLLFPGLVGGSPHLHIYTGNSLSNGNSTYSTLRTTGTGTCSGNRLNRSTYWFPAIYTDSTHIKVPDYIVLYYNYGLAALDGQADDAYHTPARLPRGFTMIGGEKPGDLNYYDAPPGVVAGTGNDFVNGDPEAPLYQCAESGAFNTDVTLVDCVAGDPLIVQFSFPTCWDGVNLSSATGRTHVTYKVRNVASGKQVCPTSHPYLIAAVEQKITYSHNGPSDYENWWLSSDRMTVDPAGWSANWATMHMDYREAWSDTFRDIFQHECNGLTYNSVTGTPHSCGDPHVGDGRLFKNDFISFAETLDAANIISAPSRTATAVTRLKFRFRGRR